MIPCTVTPHQQAATCVTRYSSRRPLFREKPLARRRDSGLWSYVSTELTSDIKLKSSGEETLNSVHYFSYVLKYSCGRTNSGKMSLLAKIAEIENEVCVYCWLALESVDESQIGSYPLRTCTARGVK